MDDHQPWGSLGVQGFDPHPYPWGNFRPFIHELWNPMNPDNETRTLQYPIHMGVSTNGGIPKWLVFNGKSDQNRWFRGTRILGNLHIAKIKLLIPVTTSHSQVGLPRKLTSCFAQCGPSTCWFGSYMFMPNFDGEKENIDLPFYPIFTHENNGLPGHIGYIPLNAVQIISKHLSNLNFLGNCSPLFLIYCSYHFSCEISLAARDFSIISWKCSSKKAGIALIHSHVPVFTQQPHLGISQPQVFPAKIVASYQFQYPDIPLHSNYLYIYMGKL